MVGMVLYNCIKKIKKRHITELYTLCILLSQLQKLCIQLERYV